MSRKVFSFTLVVSAFAFWAMTLSSCCGRGCLVISTEKHAPVTQQATKASQHP